MNFPVLRSRRDLQILRPVVGVIKVDMMHNFAFPQQAIQLQSCNFPVRCIMRDHTPLYTISKGKGLLASANAIMTLFMPG